jgi:hypothetical protein
MVHRAFLFSSLAVLGLSLVVFAGKRQVISRGKLWAGLSVNHALYTSGWTNEMVMEFAVLNEGTKPAAINPCIDHSTLVVNGAELTGKDRQWFSFNLANGPRPNDPLPAARGTSIVKSGFGQFFDRPGIYKVVWKSDCFESYPVTFRVMPRQQQ